MIKNKLLVSRFRVFEIRRSEKDIKFIVKRRFLLFFWIEVEFPEAIGAGHRKFNDLEAAIDAVALLLEIYPKPRVRRVYDSR